MPAQPTNCFICKSTWLGPGAICDDCTRKLRNIAPRIVQPPPPCSYCGSSGHVDADCLQAAVNIHAAKIAYARLYGGGMASSRSRRNPFTQPYRPATPLKYCPACKSNYLIESKAGSVCSNCRTVIHNACRNCGLSETKGIKGDGTQFIECQSCLFIE